MPGCGVAEETAERLTHFLHFAMRAVVARVAARIKAGVGDSDALGARGDAAATAAQLLEQILPLDEERLGEAQVWLAFTVQGAVDEGIARIRREVPARSGLSGSSARTHEPDNPELGTTLRQCLLLQPNR